MIKSVSVNLKSIIYNPKSTNRRSQTLSLSKGFTIVELLVVIVVIGVLAAITVVSYTGISQKAVVSSIQSDLDNASKQLKLYYTDHGAYPTSLSSNCPVGPADTKYCLKPSSGNTFTYTATPSVSTSPQAFRLNAINSNTSYSITNSTQPAIATTATDSSIGSACPTGFIPVPGSGTYGTNDFCVMQYEAKQVGATTTPVSEAAGTPWVSISQTTAITNSANVADCTGCHLITEAEWMTIVQNVLSVNANWSNGTVGNGCIYRGNLGLDDACGYNGADPESGTGRNAKASLTLTNSQVIWDLAGNVWEWTAGQTTGGQPGMTGESAYAWKSWMSITAAGTLSPNVTPASTGITGSSTWVGSKEGIGILYSKASDATLRGFLRGGNYSHGIFSAFAGVMYLNLSAEPTNIDSSFGFRVSR